MKSWIASITSILITTMLVNGCAYRQAMDRERARSGTLEDDIRREESRGADLRTQRASLEAAIATEKAALANAQRKLQAARQRWEQVRRDTRHDPQPETSTEIAELENEVASKKASIKEKQELLNLLVDY